jgi:hypothetical protein
MAHVTCCLAGSASYLADLREDLRTNGIIRAIRDHDTPALFDWLIRTLSFQGPINSLQNLLSGNTFDFAHNLLSTKGMYASLSAKFAHGLWARRATEFCGAPTPASQNECCTHDAANKQTTQFNLECCSFVRRLCKCCMVG